MTERRDHDGREGDVRQMAAQQGLELVQSPDPAPTGAEDDEGGYMLVDPARNYAVFGAIPIPFSATLDEIETYLADPNRRPAVGSDS